VPAGHPRPVTLEVEQARADRADPTAWSGPLLAKGDSTRIRGPMSYIDANLLPGEQVVYRTRLHWLLFMAPVLFTVVVLLPAAWFVVNGAWSHFAWIPLVLALGVLLVTYIKRRGSDFAVTNKRVMMKMGVFSTRSIELLLNKIEAIAVNQSFLGRTLGYGDIVITGSGGSRETFSRIQGPLAFRRAVQSVADLPSNLQARSALPDNAS
jgi:membrane protein YdbS with pleckstrin-like domain